MPFYAEECASMLAVTFSGGDKMLRSIVSAPRRALGFPFPSRSVSPRVCPCWKNGAEDSKYVCVKGFYL